MSRRALSRDPAHSNDREPRLNREQGNCLPLRPSACSPHVVLRDQADGDRLHAAGLHQPPSQDTGDLPRFRLRPRLVASTATAPQASTGLAASSSVSGVSSVSHVSFSACMQSRMVRGTCCSNRGEQGPQIEVFERFPKRQSIPQAAVPPDDSGGSPPHFKSPQIVQNCLLVSSLSSSSSDDFLASSVASPPQDGCKPCTARETEAASGGHTPGVRRVSSRGRPATLRRATESSSSGESFFPGNVYEASAFSLPRKEETCLLRLGAPVWSPPRSPVARARCHSSAAPCTQAESPAKAAWFFSTPRPSFPPSCSALLSGVSPDVSLSPLRPSGFCESPHTDELAPTVRCSVATVSAETEREEEKRPVLDRDSLAFRDDASSFRFRASTETKTTVPPSSGSPSFSTTTASSFLFPSSSFLPPSSSFSSSSSFSTSSSSCSPFHTESFAAAPDCMREEPSVCTGEEAEEMRRPDSSRGAACTLGRKAAAAADIARSPPVENVRRSARLQELYARRKRESSPPEGRSLSAASSSHADGPPSLSTEISACGESQSPPGNGSLVAGESRSAWRRHCRRSSPPSSFSFSSASQIDEQRAVESRSVTLLCGASSPGAAACAATRTSCKLSGDLRKLDRGRRSSADEEAGTARESIGEDLSTPVGGSCLDRLKEESAEERRREDAEERGEKKARSCAAHTVPKGQTLWGDAESGALVETRDDRRERLHTVVHRKAPATEKTESAFAASFSSWFPSSGSNKGGGASLVSVERGGKTEPGEAHFWTGEEDRMEQKRSSLFVTSVDDVFHAGREFAPLASAQLTRDTVSFSSSRKKQGSQAAGSAEPPAEVAPRRASLTEASREEGSQEATDTASVEFPCPHSLPSFAVSSFSSSSSSLSSEYASPPSFSSSSSASKTPSCRLCLSSFVHRSFSSRTLQLRQQPNVPSASSSSTSPSSSSTSASSICTSSSSFSSSSSSVSSSFSPFSSAISLSVGDEQMCGDRRWPEFDGSGWSASSRFPSFPRLSSTSSRLVASDSLAAAAAPASPASHRALREVERSDEGEQLATGAQRRESGGKRTWASTHAERIDLSTASAETRELCVTVPEAETPKRGRREREAKEMTILRRVTLGILLFCFIRKLLLLAWQWPRALSASPEKFAFSSVDLFDESEAKFRRIMEALAAEFPEHRHRFLISEPPSYAPHAFSSSSSAKQEYPSAAPFVSLLSDFLSRFSSRRGAFRLPDGDFSLARREDPGTVSTEDSSAFDATEVETEKSAAASSLFYQMKAFLWSLPFSSATGAPPSALSTDESFEQGENADTQGRETGDTKEKFHYRSWRTRTPKTAPLAAICSLLLLVFRSWGALVRFVCSWVVAPPLALLFRFFLSLLFRLSLSFFFVAATFLGVGSCFLFHLRGFCALAERDRRAPLSLPSASSPFRLSASGSLATETSPRRTESFAAATLSASLFGDEAKTAEARAASSLGGEATETCRSSLLHLASCASSARLCASVARPLLPVAASFLARALHAVPGCRTPNALPEESKGENEREDRGSGGEQIAAEMERE
ncbi:hypothetical protein TGME49_214630 [Toxoplasma gondii ME49]|uniref:Transmembrane protein n=1 Tax=Toxoplasma gondii (strain ATCC 50611 / Me49) TaxID=508771 RepID=S8EVY4_TOXGM|nr:hypothetical protein TGME49_214630 [Toxoplasma gondii ME49]EPT26522.1 hypothetical protein TGME49_214630 [Toxoplasma gondii ME49]|eukprot:XP_018635724.1 hypothetical protein TGME49_214630 [Toxoplasma gondii ME49]